MSTARILLVDDDSDSLASTRRILEWEGWSVDTASDGQEALERVQQSGVASYDLVVTDVRMPRLGGLEFLRAIELCGKKIPVVMMTAFGRVEDAVWAMKCGAVDFLTKPFKRQVLIEAVHRALARRGALIPASSGEETWIGSSQFSRDLAGWVAQVAPTNASVLLSGESGTGKERVARWIHTSGPRAAHAFVALNCAAVPESLMEAELFGHERGAFTGATQSKPGLFESANGGTLLLDEIGDMPLSLQAKLLRVLQEGEVRRLGASQSRKIDVRVIAASHRRLRDRVAEGAFREDLLYRLEVVSLEIQPLRHRREDILPLIGHFLHLFAQKHNRAELQMSPEAVAVLERHAWPGNTRELANVIERAVIFAKCNPIEVTALPAHLLDQQGISSHAETAPGESSTISISVGTPLKDVEDLLIRKTLEVTSGDKEMTAKLLGINSRTIYRKLKEGRSSAPPEELEQIDGGAPRDLPTASEPS